MLFEAVVITLLVLVLGYKLWQEWNHGDLKTMNSTFQAKNEANNDVFGGETRTLHFVLDGKEMTFEVKTLNDMMTAIWEAESNGIVYLQSSREHGLRLEFDITLGNDDMLDLRTMRGDETVGEQTINLDKAGPMEIIRSFQTVFGDLRASTGAWWNE
jgi:hypothetical protein